MFGLLRDFFFEHEPTVEDAYRKSDNVEGWSVEVTQEGHTVHGTDAYGEPHSWPFGTDQVTEMNYLLDHVNSVKIGDEYRREKWGLQPGEEDTSEEWCERKYEIREHREQTYYHQEYKPGWKRLLGL